MKKNKITKIIFSILLFTFSLVFLCTGNFYISYAQEGQEYETDDEGDNPASKLDTPTINGIDVYDNCILAISWDGVIYASGYDIYRSDSENGEYTKIGTREAIGGYWEMYNEYTFADKDLTFNNTYYYKVIPYIMDNGVAYYGESSQAKAQTVSKDYVVPVISDLSVSSDGDYADISWKANVSSYSYTLSYANAKKGNYEIIENNTFSDSDYWYWDDDIKAECSYTMTQGVPYYFRVVITSFETYTVNENNEIEFSNVEKRSNTLTSQKVMYSLDKPVVTIANVDSQGISLSWAPIENASGYYIYRSNSENGTYKKVYTQKKKKKETKKEKYTYYDYDEKTGEFKEKYGYEEVPITYNYTETKLTLGKTYYYKVIPYFTYNNTKYQNEPSDIVNKQVTLNNIYIKTAKSNKPCINTLTWNKIPKAEGYIIYYSKTIDGKYKKLKTIKGNKTTKYTHNKLKNGQSYYYKVAAYKTVSGKKVFSTTDIYEKYCDYYGYEYESYYNKAMRIQGKPEITQYKNAKEASKHMKTISIKVWDLDSNNKYYTRTFYLTMHEKIAPTVKQIFKEIYKSKEKTPIHAIGGYDYSGTWNEHMLGLAIDVNPNENAMFDDGVAVVGSFFNPKKSPYSIADDSDFVKIMNKYGFYRGKWGTRLDYMHFSFFGT